MLSHGCSQRRLSISSGGSQRLVRNSLYVEIATFFLLDVIGELGEPDAPLLVLWKFPGTEMQEWSSRLPLLPELPMFHIQSIVYHYPWAIAHLQSLQKGALRLCLEAAI